MFFKKERQFAFSPVSGKVINLEDVNDDVFSKKIMGEGVAIIPDEMQIVSPFNCTVTAVLDSNHAIGLTTDDGIEAIVHVGLDTVNLKGRGFKCFVNEGDIVKVGDQLLAFDKDVIEAEGYDTITMLVVSNTNSKQIVIMENLDLAKAGQTKIIEFI